MIKTHLDPLSDEEIITGCRAGRDSAWQSFVDRFSGLVHWSVWKYTQDLPQAEREDVGREVFQDFFLQLVEKRSLDQLKDAAKIRKFIVVSVTHLAQNKLRQRRRVSSWEQPLDEAVTADEVADPAFQEAVVKQLDLLASVYEDLDPKEKVIMDFCYAEGMTHGDIAILLGIPQDTVSTVIRRSKEKIRKKMMENDK